MTFPGVLKESWLWRNRTDVKRWHIYEEISPKKNNLASHLIPSTQHLSRDPLRRSDTEAGKQEPKHVGAGQTPKCGGWKVLTLHWLSGELGVRWVWEGKISLLVCVNWARVSRACYSLSAGWPGEKGLPSPAALLPAASPNATFIKGTSDTGSVSQLFTFGLIGNKARHNRLDREQSHSQIRQATVKL